jgi:PAS domain S-box-containing protein
MTDMILVLDTQDRIVDINPTTERYLEKTAPHPIGKALKIAWPELFEAIQEYQENPIEIELATGATTKHHEVTISSLKDWRNARRGRLLVLHDITYRKELEQKREDMTHTMVHDLRDPLSNSLFALEMLKGDLSVIESPESDQLLEVTVEQTMKTLRLVDEILEISRLKNGIEMLISRTAFSLAEVIERVIESQAPRATERQLTLQYDFPESMPLAWSDMNLIERVLQNLLDNSIKFSPTGGTVQVEVNLVQDNGLASGTHLLVSVTDEGPGIPIDLQERIFEKFVTGPIKGSGTGLGLAYCKMAMTALDGSIWVENRSGRGAEFSFSLPVAFESIPNAEPA